MNDRKKKRRVRWEIVEQLSEPVGGKLVLARLTVLPLRSPKYSIQVGTARDRGDDEDGRIQPFFPPEAIEQVHSMLTALLEIQAADQAEREAAWQDYNPHKQDNKSRNPGVGQGLSKWSKHDAEKRRKCEGELLPQEKSDTDRIRMKQ